MTDTEQGNFVDQLRFDDEPGASKKTLVLPGQRKVPLSRRLRSNWQLYLLLLPALIWVAIFAYWPMYGIQIAFRNYTPVGGLTGSEWVGLDHIERFVTSYNFSKLLGNTLILAFYELLAGIPIPIMLALALNAVRQKYFSRVVQLITYAPNFISVVVVVGILVMLLDPQSGILPHALSLVGIDAPAFLTDPSWFRHTYVWSGVWQTAGFSAIIYLAALSSVPPELHEAAKVDGASHLRRIWHIDLPAILPIAVVLMILSVGSIMSVGFEKVLLMQNQLNLTTSQVIDTYVYEVGLNSPIPQYSYATAIGLFRSVIGLILLVAVNYLSRRITRTGLF
ncbi:MAG: ABC transporter permease [Brachybacterium tyrofermentans]|uniref:ABC transporter permease n=1 Tax=Brachybacterium tyrofermentans TaxID=47848 RepID=A0ABW0FDD8_9MICO|nr:ABC transporter, permease protein [Corynebacterium xerosis]